MTNKLLEFISNIVDLDEKEQAIVAAKIPIKEYKAGDVLLREGMASKTAYFNLKGCVRLYFLIDGEEKTTFFYTENQFITSIRSFTTNTPSDHYLECVEDCNLALISYEVEKELLKTIPKLETFARISLEKEVANYQAMLSSYIMSSPEQRYQNILKKNPELLQRIPQYQLASYIGIKAQSLSRIRKRISQKSS